MRKEYLIILGLVIVIILLVTCNGKPTETKIITKTVTRVDSIHTVDTFERVIHVPIKQIEYITVIDTNKDFNTYHYGQKDTLLTINAYVNSKIKPFSVLFDYDIKQFTIHDSIYIRDSVHVKEQIKKSFVSLGGTVLGNKNNFGLAPHIMYSHKSGNNLSFGYDIINENFMIGYSKKISFKSK